MADTLPRYDTDEILWYDNGIWGRSGYAIPNPGGKTWTVNAVINNWVSGVGRALFELSHRDDVKFYGPPKKQFWFDLHKMIITGRKRLADQTRKPNDSSGLDPEHVNPNPRIYVCYPVPFFGERVRQQDVRYYIEIMLMGLSEAMQHSANDHVAYVTEDFTGQIGKFLQEVLAQFSMKYFGKTRVEAYDPAFSLSDDDFKNYDPSKVLASFEMTEERPPIQWWPTENDLSQIRALPINEALGLAKRWPTTDWLMQADGNVFPDPTRQGVVTNTNGSGRVPAGAGGIESGANVGFQSPPGQAP
jgi:hypothetical protein